MKVPFVDLQKQHKELQNEIDQVIHKVMDKSDFILGEDVSRFEEEFASYCNARFAIGVASGISALEMILRALDIGAGDEVILPANTFIATAAAVTFAGAKPVLVDVRPDTYNIDVSQIESAITPRTQAILPVHLYGQPADMDLILQIASKHGLAVIEDACQAHGAVYQGKRVGSIGTAGAFSFYPTKNLGSCGDAGMVVTDDIHIAEKVRAMRNCGQRKKYYHELRPFNYRLDTIQAAILRIKLHYLDTWIGERQRNASYYHTLLDSRKVKLPRELPDRTHVYHLFVIQANHRDELQAYLREHDVGSAIHYPVPIHMQPFYLDERLTFRKYPITENLCDRILSLPMFPELTNAQIEYVADLVNAFVGNLPEELSEEEMVYA
jgi:dTDP-4-amino-4,6-dideoxygalactose transaminase